MIGRLSSMQRFDGGKDYIVTNQSGYAEHTLRMNTGQRLLNNYDQIGGNKDLVQVTGQIANSSKLTENNKKASTELEFAESALNSMKNIMDQIKTDAIQGGSDTIAREDLEILGVQLRNLGENIYQLANTKLGGKYIFGGKQSDLKVVDYSPNALFSEADFKEGQTDLGERYVQGLQSSISLADFFSTSASHASYTGSTFTTPLGTNAQVNIVVNDGSTNINVGDVSLAAGDSINTIVTKINTAFTNAGGAGSIVSNSSGTLAFTTSTITGSSANGDSAVIISPGASLPNSLSDLGLVSGTSKGTSGDIRQTLAKLDTAYNTNDSEGVRTALVDIQSNIDRLISAQAKLGDLVKKFNDAETRNSEKTENLKIDQADIARIPTVEAIKEVTLAQNVLNATLQASATVMKMNIFDFISL